MAAMTPEIAICLAIVAVAIVLFAWERIAADVIALGVMLACVITGLLAPREAFAGFSSDTVIMILGLLIMTAGLANTGVVDIAGRAILGYAGGKSGHLLLPTILISVAVLSSFISNTAATAFFLPVVLGLRQEARYQRLEIPPAARLRLDRVELGHPHQHLDQHRRERAHDPTTASRPWACSRWPRSESRSPSPGSSTCGRSARSSSRRGTSQQPADRHRPPQVSGGRRRAAGARR